MNTKTTLSASGGDNYSISGALNYVKNSGAAYADAVFDITAEQTDELTIEVRFVKNGAPVGRSVTKKIANAAQLNGGCAALRAEIPSEGELTVTARLYKTASPDAVLSKMSRTVNNRPSFADTANIRLKAGCVFDRSRATGLDYIKGIDVARLLQPSYEMHDVPLLYEEGVDAGQSPDRKPGDAAERYGGWERKGASNWGSSEESFTLAGEAMGHWLSAAAVFYRETHDETLLSRMNYLVNKLTALQSADMGANTKSVSKAYIGGCPEDAFTKCFAGNADWASGYWVPWYGVHKIYQGLLDVYDYAPEETAIKAYGILRKFSEWAVDGTANLTDAQLQKALDVEYGGMNEIFARMYEITGDSKYLNAGRRFTHDSVINPLISDNGASLSGKHANTQIPKFVGAAELYEQDCAAYADYRTACESFWHNVNYERCYAIGGNSLSEHFQTAGTEELGVKTCESCNTYNMMRLTEHIFSWNYADDNSEYMDWYEKALYNHILGQQEPTTGAKMYFVSLLQGHHRIYEDKYNSWWCCTLTGMENPGRYTRAAYFEDNENDTLYVNLYMPGTYKWKKKGLTFTVETEYPYSEQVKIKVVGGNSINASIKLRAPSWIASPVTASVGGQAYSSEGGTYLSVNRLWNENDELTAEIPMKINVYKSRDESKIAYSYGPVVLAADLGSCADVIGVAEYTSNETQLDVTQAEYPHIHSHGETDYSSFVAADDISRLTFSIKAENSSAGRSIALKPFYKIHHSFHNVYWDLDSPGDKYAKWLNSIQIDRVEPDGQQDELGHGLAQNAEDINGYCYQSHQGSAVIGGKSYYWRDAYGSADAFFKYNMGVRADMHNYLFVRYSGDDTATGYGERRFNIFVDGVRINEEVIVLNAVSSGGVRDRFYDIPLSLTRGKSTVQVKFAPADAACVAGGYLEMRTATAKDMS